MRRTLRISTVCMCVIAMSGFRARAAEWQFSVPVTGTKSQAWMWIPPTCRQVRGVIVAQQVILENTALEDSAIRAAAAESDLAEVIVCPGFDTTFNYDKTRGNSAAPFILQQTLTDLAAESGYGEIATAPLLPIGHSGAGIFCWNLAYWAPKRVIGLVTLHSAPLSPPVWDLKANIDGVPVLADTGQYESWTGPKVSLEQHWRWVRGQLLYFRGFNQRSLTSMVIEPGAGHFSWSPKLAQQVALFIRTVAKARLSADTSIAPPATTEPSTQPSAALAELPLRSGWLTDSDFLSKSRHAPAAYDQYQGDPSLAFWHINEQLATANEQFESEYKGKADQRVTFLQDGKQIPNAWIEKVDFHPTGDGMTVKMQADFASKTPEGVANAGQPIGHSSKGAIHFRLIGGWAGGGEQVGPDTFRIRFGHFGISRRSDNIMVMAYHEGDDQFAYAEQAAVVTFPWKNEAGEKQTIHFDKIADMAAGKNSVELHAIADSGLPVEFLVNNGPAQIATDGKTLLLTAIPPRTTFPVKVTVLAYQWGCSIDPKVQSAVPVEQTFSIFQSGRIAQTQATETRQ